MHPSYLLSALYHIQVEDLLKGLSFMFDMRPPKNKAQMQLESVCLAKLIYLYISFQTMKSSIATSIDLTLSC